MGQTTRFSPPVRGYGVPRKEESMDRIGINTLLLVLILLVETAYVVHVW